MQAKILSQLATPLRDSYPHQQCLAINLLGWLLKVQMRLVSLRWGLFSPLINCYHPRALCPSFNQHPKFARLSSREIRALRKHFPTLVTLIVLRVAH